MRTIPAAILGLSLMLGLAGCKADRDDDRSYVEIGEARVYEAPRPAKRERSTSMNKSVPAPKALPELAQKAERSRPKVTRSRQYVTVGELVPD